MFERMTRTSMQVSPASGAGGRQSGSFVSAERHLGAVVALLMWPFPSPPQGKISELELRMYLAAQGLRGAEVTLVADDFKDIPDGADGSVSFWEWAK